MITVLSLFDGMSCGQIALNKIGIKKYKYYASEIKKHAIKCTQYNYPDTVQIGDVTKVSYKEGVLYTENGNFKVGKIDLLLGGSPCQDFSLLKIDGRGLEGNKSKLFYEYLRILKEVSPEYFLLENVKMKNESKKQLDEYLGVEGKYINSNLVSYQNRPRYYWSNIQFDIPEDKEINFQDFKEKTDLEKYKVKKTPSRIRMWNNGKGRNNKSSCANITEAKKIYCITRKQDRSPNSGLIKYEDFCRYLTRRELELGQTVPAGYTDCVSYSQCQDLLGDGWTVDVIEHILKKVFYENKCENCEKYNNFICGKNGNYILPTMEIMMNCNR